MWWMMVSVTAIVGVAVEGRIPCEEARMKCAYRVGCGMALRNYLVGCSSVLQGPADHCPEICQHSLIALTSTEEGKKLMQCECNDEFCEESKRRVDICRPTVMRANLNETVVSCTVAQWICAADALCSTALDYYNRFCKSMFHGRKCTHRCLNSISILLRQEKAHKLKTCKCDGQEDYDCPRIQGNMARLCFHEKATTTRPLHEETGDTDTNIIVQTVSAAAPSLSTYTLLTAFAVLLTVT